MNRFRKLNNVFSWVFLAAMIGLLILSIISLVNVKGTDEPVFILGHRLIYLTSGSMEPTIKTNALSVSRRVDSLGEIEVGDIVSFKFIDDRDNKTYRATHRVVEIDTEKNQVLTKGDNNAVVDSHPVSINDIESKVVLTMNWTADIVNTWNSGSSGRILIIISLVAVIVLYFLMKMLIKAIWKYIQVKKGFNTKE